MSVKLDPCPTRMRRPRRFNAGGTAFHRSPARSEVVECKYDSLGRRCEKKVSVDGETTFHQRHAYRNYLQIAAFDVSVDSETEEEVLSLATTTAWDPMEPQATRPLAFTEHSGDAPATYFHTHDLTKNVCELIDSNGAPVSACDCAPFGAVAISGTPTRNPFQFSSEVYDPETALVYYNCRHYNPIDGRWISRDPLREDEQSASAYSFSVNCPINTLDLIGLAYSRCILLSKSKATQIKTKGSKHLLTFINTDLRVGIVLQRKCYFRCYYDFRENCRKIPCRDRCCQKDHGIEELVVTNSPDGVSPAPNCSDQYNVAIQRGELTC